MRLGNFLKEPIPNNHKSSKSARPRTVDGANATRDQIKEQAYKVRIKPKYNANEIRAKIEAEKLADITPQKEEEVTVENSEVESDEGKADDSAHVLNGDVGVNDSNDDMVKEKLKAVLSFGAFSFDEKTKGVLAKILNKSNKEA